MAKFTVHFNNEFIKTYELKDPVVTIGRLPENTISIANMGVSRRHVRIERDSAQNYVLTDLNSLNGTFVNNNRVKKTALASGDTITIGKYSLAFDSAESVTATDQKMISKKPPTGIVDMADMQKAETTEKRKDQPPMILSETPSEAGAAPGHSVLIETNRHLIYKLEKPLITMGNSETDDIILSGTFFGKVQLSIERQGAETWLQSKSIMAKVKVNGKSVKLHQLQHKDRIEIGKNTFRYMENG
jgi:pSer/pThr/pTyr-binding forkhead associated (FHA) protein